MPTEKKIIEIVAGPNGSGKTTFAESYLLRTKNNLTFLNPDLIASGIAPLDFERASFQAGRVLISEVNARIARNENFAFESTLSGRTWVNALRKAQSANYSINIYFLYLDTINKNLKRIKTRVRLGGHHIPDVAVIRRQPRCFDNFWTLYRPLASNWYVLDNSGRAPKMILNKTIFDSMTLKQQLEFEVRFTDGSIYGKK